MPYILIINIVMRWVGLVLCYWPIKKLTFSELVLDGKERHATVVSYVNVSIIKSKSLNCKALRRVSLLCYIGEALYTSVTYCII